MTLCSTHHNVPVRRRFKLVHLHHCMFSDKHLSVSVQYPVIHRRIEFVTVGRPHRCGVMKSEVSCHAVLLYSVKIASIMTGASQQVFKRVPGLFDIHKEYETRRRLEIHLVIKVHAESINIERGRGMTRLLRK